MEEEGPSKREMVLLLLREETESEEGGNTCFRG